MPSTEHSVIYVSANSAFGAGALAGGKNAKDIILPVREVREQVSRRAP